VTRRGLLSVAAVALSALAVACGDATGSGDAELDGDWIAIRVEADELPVPVRCGLGGCTWLSEAQIRFRTRGRLLDLRRFFQQVDGQPPTGHTEYGDAFAYQRFARDSFRVIRPFADTAYADTGVVRGDTIRIHLRKLEQQFGGIGSGRGPLATYVRREAIEP